jgi:hypothetical protein
MRAGLTLSGATSTEPYVAEVLFLTDPTNYGTSGSPCYGFYDFLYGYIRVDPAVSSYEYVNAIAMSSLETQPIIDGRHSIHTNT